VVVKAKCFVFLINLSDTPSTSNESSVANNQFDDLKIVNNANTKEFCISQTQTDQKEEN
jgi:hypothetical protein